MCTREILRENLKFYRKKAGLTQETLAEKINCSPKYISSIESKSSFPSAETIDAICQVLGISPSQLFQESGCPQNLIKFEKADFVESVIGELYNLLKEDMIKYLDEKI